MSAEHRRNPDSPENEALTTDNERAVFAAQMQAKPRCPECGGLLILDTESAVTAREWLMCEDCGRKEP